MQSISMAVGSTKEFAEVLKASQLFEADALAEILRKHSTDDPKILAGKLAQDGTLTRWQAKMIYSGYHKLKLGNYVLLDRISRDDLGDRFLANHKSLDREVEIQVLPKRISEEPQLQSFFTSNIGMVAELDHPHITHIHDVDRAGGQFFLVDEAQQGVPLNEVELTADGLVLCCNQILQALAYAHSQGVVHGDVNLNSIMYASQSHFKLRGISLSLVRRKLAGSSDSTARDDHIAFANLLDQKFQSLRPELRDELGWFGKQILLLKENPISEYPRVLSATKQHLEAWGESTRAITVDEMKDHPTAAPTISGTNRTVPTNESSSSSDQKTSPSTNAASKESTGGVPKPALIGGIVVCSLLVILGGLYAAGVFSGKKESAKNDDSQPVTSTPVVNPSNEQTPNDRKPSVRNPDDLPGPTDQNNGEKTESAPVEVPEDADSNSSNNSNPVLVDSDSPASATEGDALPDTVSDEGQPDDESMAQNDGSTQEETTEDQTEPAAPVAFEQIPDVIDLPTTEFKEDFLIGQLGENDQITELEIIAAPSAFSNGKGAFAVKAIDDVTWEVQLLSKPNGTGSPVARIAVADQALSYTWLEEVSKKSKANALRNGVLRLKSIEGKKDLVLRKPVALDLQLTADAYSFKVNTKADWLPQADSIRVEVQKPADPWPSRLYLQDGTQLPETFLFDEERNPLIILFSSKPEEQFVSVVLTPQINRKLTFEMGVFAKGKNTNPVQYESAKTAEETIELLQKAREAQAIAKEQAAAAVAHARQVQNGTITKREEDLRDAKRTYNEIDSNVDIAEDIRDQLNELHDARLQVTVFYELDGRRIVLAESAADPSDSE